MLWAQIALLVGILAALLCVTVGFVCATPPEETGDRVTGLITSWIVLGVIATLAYFAGAFDLIF